MRPSKLAIMPFVLNYKEDKVSSITGEQGIPITYNSAVNVPLVGRTVQSVQPERVLPIFESSLETMNPENRVLPENAFDEGGKIGYYEKDGKLYTGYLKKIGEIEVTYGSGQKAMVPIHVTKVRDRGFGREGEFGASSEYLTVFPNGKAISTKTNDTNDDHAAEVIMKALSAKPEKVLSLSSEKTQIHNPRELEESELKIRLANLTPGNTSIRDTLEHLLSKSGRDFDYTREGKVNVWGRLRDAEEVRHQDGTKWTIQDYIKEVERLLSYIEETRVRDKQVIQELGKGYKGLDEARRGTSAFISSYIKRIDKYLAAAFMLLNREESSQFKSTTPVQPQGGASKSIQKNDSVNQHDDEFEDDLVLYDDFFDNPDYGKNVTKIENLEIEKGIEYTSSKIEELFSKFSTAEQREELSYLADRVFKIAKQLGIKIIFSDDFSFGVKGKYSSNNSIKFNHKFFTDDFLNHTKAPILLHEMIHAVTMYILSDKMQDRITGNLKEAADAIRAVYDSIKNDPTLIGEYGVSNVKEMIAEMANPRFRTKLKKLNVWQRIKEAIKKLFSLDTKSATAFDTLDKALDLILDSFDIDLYNDYVGAKKYGSYNSDDWAFYRAATNKEKARVASEVRNWAGGRVYQGNSPNSMIDDLGNGYILTTDGLFTYTYKTGKDVENIKHIYKNSDINRKRIAEFIDDFHKHAYYESSEYKTNQSWAGLSQETQEYLETKGWTQEKFNSISQEERDQAVRCIGL